MALTVVRVVRRLDQEARRVLGALNNGRLVHDWPPCRL